MRPLKITMMLLTMLPVVICAQENSHYRLVENKGQWPTQVQFAADIEQGKMFLESNALTYHFYDLSSVRAAHAEGKIFNADDVRIKGHVYHVNFDGANQNAPTIPTNKQPTYYNYFLGNESNKWAAGCAAFGTVERKNFYEHIDFQLYSRDFFLKYDFIVHPGGVPSQIQMTFDGVDHITIENERVKISTSVNEVWEQKPIAWQVIQGEKHYVQCKYVLKGTTIGYEFPNGYDHQVDLVIDPEIVFSSYSGSSSDNFGYTATYDEEGYLYSGSSAFGQNYPVTTGAYQVTHQGGDSTIEEGIDMALSKYDVSGTFMVWSTFLGGSGDDLPHSIITNSENELLVYGSTGSNNFPVTNGAIDNSFGGGSLVSPTGTGANFPNGSDIVVAHFNWDCTDLIGSTYIGGSGNDGVCTSTALKHNYADEFRGEISLDELENILIVSSSFSVDFPTENAFQNNLAGMQDAVVLKLNPLLTNIIWSTYLGGSTDDSGFSITNNSTGDLYICGGTNSANFPVTGNSVQNTFGAGLADGYVFKLSANGQNMEGSTFWGTGEYDQLYFIEVDDEDLVYVFGQTLADNSDMIINAGYGTPNSGNLLTKFNADLTAVIWSTVFGTGNAKPNLSPSAFLVDYCNRVYISGWGITTVANNPLNPGANLHSMNNMETTSDAFDNTCSTGDFYMAVFDENMTQLEYGTFYGGSTSSEHVDGGTSRFDRKGVIYQSVCAGCGGNDDFPIYPSNAWSSVNNSSCNNGVYKFDFQLPITIADFTIAPTGCTNVPIQFTSTSTFALTYEWHFGDGDTSNNPNPQHIYDEAGTYTITLIVTHDATCNGVDSVSQTIEIISPVSGNLDDIPLCEGESASLGLSSTVNEYVYQWTPATYLNNANIANPTFNNGTSTEYTLSVMHDGCTDIYTQNVDVTNLQLQAPEDTTLCDDIPLTLAATYSPSNALITWSDMSDFSNVLNDNTSDADIDVNIAIPTTFYILVTLNGCSEQEEVFVNLVSFQTVIEGDFTTCMGDTVELSVLEPNPDFTYTWTPAQLVIEGQNTPSVQVMVMQETVFTVYSTTSTNCTASDEVTVTVSDLNASVISATATPELIVQGQSSQLNAVPADFIYTWTPSTWLNTTTSQNPVSTPIETITYTVTASDGECSASTFVTVKVLDFVCGPPSIYVPNAFTPNKDNHNEKLFVRANNLSKLYFTIYDRWGEKMFETSKIQEGWDGTFEGRDLDPDVYVYYLEATCIGGLEYIEKGNITLIR